MNVKLTPREWSVTFDKTNEIWRWMTDIGNGWTAAVTDDSQFGYPKKSTQYTIAAVSRTSIVQGKEVYLSLMEAKGYAVQLACAQPPCEP